MKETTETRRLKPELSLNAPWIDAALTLFCVLVLLLSVLAIKN